MNYQGVNILEHSWTFLTILLIKDAGLISGYTGHVPISRDQFGISYGELSYMATRKIDKSDQNVLQISYVLFSTKS